MSDDDFEAGQAEWISRAMSGVLGPEAKADAIAMQEALAGDDDGGHEAFDGEEQEAEVEMDPEEIEAAATAYARKNPERMAAMLSDEDLVSENNLLNEYPL